MTRSTTLIVLFVLSAIRLAPADPFPGTAPLTAEGDLSALMVEGIGRYLQRATAASGDVRLQEWKQVAAAGDERRSVLLRRSGLTALLGLQEGRLPFAALAVVSNVKQSVRLGTGKGFEVYAVTWPVHSDLTAEGLLLVPTGKPVADVVAIPDADQTPEMIAGLAAGVARESQFARRLAEAGCRVIIPTLVDRQDTFSMPPSGQKTNQPHREYVYRPAFQMGRHVIGYELQEILAAVDWFAADGGKDAKVGVAGYGEGGLLALYAGALDERITVTAVSGSFGPREALWQEPIYRNLFGLLNEFGDAEVGAMICPRGLVIDKAAGPKVDGPPAPHDSRRGAAPGKLAPIDPAAAGKEIARMNALTDGQPPFTWVVSPGDGPFMNAPVLRAIMRRFGKTFDGEDNADAPRLLREAPDTVARQKRLVDQMTDHTQRLVRESEQVRKAYTARLDAAIRNPAENPAIVPQYREQYQQIIGKLPERLLPPNARSRQIFDDPKYTGYEVMLDVVPDVFAYGILVVPKGMKPGERRPVVVCQHGLDGRPRDCADPTIDSKFYHQFAIKLAERGFITYSPQNPYFGGEAFRLAIRKANPLGLTLWSFIVPQHQQTTDWLAGLPIVDPTRIAFYGLSYGGKTAMRIPALNDRYCLSICSGDFNEWTWKTTSLTFPSGYPGTQEYEIFEWNLGHTFGYAEMAKLIAPRPFMVERGHRDGVAPDEWVAYEYAKVRRMYADLKIPDKTEIEFFDGPHMINGQGTFRFLYKHLNWPEPK